MTHTSAPAVTTMQSDVACRECGTIEKSGKLSCCARGGSWFGKCGSTANANVGHTWYEGVQACKARQFQAVLGQQQQQRVSQPNSNVSPDDTNMDASSKVVFATAHALSAMLVNTEVTSMSSARVITGPGNTSIIMSAPWPMILICIVLK